MGAVLPYPPSPPSSANIEIEVSEGLQTLGRETRLRPREDFDDEADTDPGHDQRSAAAGGESQPQSVRGERQSVGGAQEEWLLDPNSSDGLYSDGLTQLATELDQNAEGIWVITFNVGDDILPLGLQHGGRELYVASDDILPLGLQHGGRELYVASAAPVPPGSCFRGDEGQHELPERRCGRSVVRHQAVDPVQSRGSPSDVGDRDGGTDAARVGG
ncbi:hypothetical protein V502_04341 [Pseudogymnoascus sp. VKM F-4520 (FW-2644)]|nr:hypothetical protein V502_04341 [Pseudogymnoascus sp. VKM F-4520 (FW-2644)]